MPALAQQDFIQRFEVPSQGISRNDIFRAGDLWNEYIVHVESNHELTYRFQVIGDGQIMVSLIPGAHPAVYSDSYTSFSTSRPVTEYTATFPATGFDKDYSIVVNSSHPGDVTYTVSIHTEPAEVPNYMPYYILIALGFAALVAVCWKVVVWQEAQERMNKKGKRGGKRGR